MKKILIILSLISCSKPLPKHETVFRQEYDVPAKSQVERKIVLKDSITIANVDALLNDAFNEECYTSMKYHSNPTHVFIYVYDDSTDYKTQSHEWLGMISRVMGKDEGIQHALYLH